jgi:hypothetical protein
MSVPQSGMSKGYIKYFRAMCGSAPCHRCKLTQLKPNARHGRREVSPLVVKSDGDIFLWLRYFPSLAYAKVGSVGTSTLWLDLYQFFLMYVMLCYAMLCYAMLCYAMLCYAMLCYVTRKATYRNAKIHSCCVAPILGSCRHHR